MNNPLTIPLDDYDRELLKHLATVINAVDPVPSSLDDRVLFELSLAELDAELAVLVDQESVALRSVSSATSETVTFAASALNLMVHFSEDDDAAVRIDAWVTEGGAQVALLSHCAEHWETSTANGRLTWRNVDRGKVRFLVKPCDPAARPVITPELDV